MALTSWIGDRGSESMSALETYREKLLFLEEQQAICSDPAQLFTLQEQIKEVKSKINELEDELGGIVGSGDKEEGTQAEGQLISGSEMLPSPPVSRQLNTYLPKTRDLLIVTANPIETDILDLKREAQAIEDAITAANPKLKLVVRPEHAVSINNLRRCLHKYDPSIVHFAGHGNSKGNLLFQTEEGVEQEVTPLALGGLFKEFTSIECITLNACFTSEAAEELAETVQCVVGMGTEVDDESAVQFSLGFYEALAYGRDYATAFRLGCNAINLNSLPDADQPVAFLPNIKMGNAETHTQPSLIASRAKRSVPVKTIHSESTNNIISVKLWFGTLRKPKDPRNLARGFGNNKDKEINLGTCEVAVPQRREVGTIGSWFWYRWITWNDDRIKLYKNSIALVDHSDYWESLRQATSLLEDGKKHALIFIHGYNVSFRDAARRTAQIVTDLPLPGPAAFFSWPSRGHVFGYAADGESIKYSVDYISQFLIDFVKKSGAERIHLVAHSMGNRGLLHAMKEVTDRLDQSQPFDQLFLAAPDVDVDIFRTEGRGLCQVWKADNTVLFFSRPSSLGIKISQPRLKSGVLQTW